MRVSDIFYPAGEGFYYDGWIKKKNEKILPIFQPRALLNNYFHHSE